MAAQSVLAASSIAGETVLSGGVTDTGLMAMAVAPTSATPAAAKGRGTAYIVIPRRRVTPDPRATYLRYEGGTVNSPGIGRDWAMRPVRLRPLRRLLANLTATPPTGALRHLSPGSVTGANYTVIRINAASR